jgi:Uncharacterized protein conserved in bacteria C-term(DUF2220)
MQNACEGELQAAPCPAAKGGCASASQRSSTRSFAAWSRAARRRPRPTVGPRTISRLSARNRLAAGRIRGSGKGYRAQVVQEDNPTSPPLPLLTEAESDLYRDLVEDRYGPRIRLEQERVRFSLVRQAVAPSEPARDRAPAPWAQRD